MFKAKRKTITIALVVACLWILSLALVAWAESPIRLFVNGVEVQSDVPPQVINGRTMVPAAALAKALGATVEWDAERRAVIITAVVAGNTPTDLPSTSGSNTGTASQQSGSNPGTSNGSNNNSPVQNGSPGLGTTAAAWSWSALWDTDWGEMALIQTGTTVTGSYTHDNGKITGQVSGDTLIGTWSESPSYSTPDDAGDIKLVMSSDGKSFKGYWRYGSSGDWREWDGTKK